MTIALRTSAVGNAAGGTFVSVTIPGAVVAGDLLVAAVVTSGTAMTGPSGWSHLRTDISSNSGTPSYRNPRTEIWYKTAVSGDAGSSISWTNPSGEARLIQLTAWFDTLTPLIHVHAGNGNTGSTSSTAVTQSGVSTTTSKADCVVIGVFVVGDQATLASPLGMSQIREDQANDSGGNFRWRAETAQMFHATAGSTGTKQATASAAVYGATATLVAIAPSNSAPDAPTLVAPTDGAALDRSQPNVFDWQFSDPDAGDSQSAYNWAYRLTGAPAWTETGWIAGTSSQHTVPANTFAEGLHEWRVATKDQAGAESPWSVTRTFTAYKAATGTGLVQGAPQLSASGVVAYHLDGVGVISVAHTRSAQGIKSTAGTGLVEQDVLPVVSSGLRASMGTASVEAEPFIGIFSSGIGSGALLVTATLLARGTHQTQGEGLLYVTDVPTSTGHKWQRYFTPPGREVHGSGNRFWRRVHIEQGITVIKRDGGFIQVEHPSADDFANADKIYVGGHLYQIDDLEHLDLEAAGYTTFYSEDGT